MEIEQQIPVVTQIQGERFGGSGMFTATKHEFGIQTETVGKVDYSLHIIHRRNNPQLGKEHIEGDKKQMVLISGLDTTGTDWLRMAEQLMLDMPSVEQITLLDHPSTSGVRHENRDVALNTNSFENSAKVVSKAMEALLERGEIKKGQTAIGISTGCAVLEEVAAINPKMIDTLILCAPAGMLDRTEKQIMTGGAHGGDEYLKQFFTDLFKRVPEKYLIPKSERDQIEPVGVVKSIPHTAKERISEEALKGIKFQNFLFEIAFKVGRKFPRFWQHFTGMWGDSDPHVPIIGTDYKKDLSLVAKNTTEQARDKITGKKVVLVLGMDDQAVPPMEFLQESDRQNISSIIDENEKAEKTTDAIIARLKGKFKNNADTRVILAVGGPKTHVEIKADTELYGPVIANILEPIKPERIWTRESGWQRP
ncbi:MAG: hypothetical protein V1917_03700 [Candidatus Gottesmanbacteria bacterium]